MPGTTAAVGALESSVSDCNFAALSPPRAGKPVLSQERPGCLKSLAQGRNKDAVGDTQQGAFPDWGCGQPPGQYQKNLGAR